MSNQRIDSVFCHFSFRRPKGSKNGLFASALFADTEGKKLVIYKTQRAPLWENKQFVTAVQSYEKALSCIYGWQGQLIEAGVRQVFLVTDNSTLAGWIKDNTKNKQYRAYLEKANSLYKTGGAKEIQLAVGLCVPRKSEKSYKFCKEELIEVECSIETDKKKRIVLNTDYKSALDFIGDDNAMPKIEGMTEIE